MPRASFASVGGRRSSPPISRRLAALALLSSTAEPTLPLLAWKASCVHRRPARGTPSSEHPVGVLGTQQTGMCVQLCRLKVLSASCSQHGAADWSCYCAELDRGSREVTTLKDVCQPGSFAVPRPGPVRDPADQKREQPSSSVAAGGAWLRCLRCVRSQAERSKATPRTFTDVALQARAILDGMLLSPCERSIAKPLNTLSLVEAPH